MVAGDVTVVASTADTITFSLVGFVVALAAIVIWRIVGRDKAVRRLRFGFFYERDLDDSYRNLETGRPSEPEKEESDA